MTTIKTQLQMITDLYWAGFYKYSVAGVIFTRQTLLTLLFNYTNKKVDQQEIKMIPEQILFFHTRLVST